MDIEKFTHSLMDLNTYTTNRYYFIFYGFNNWTSIVESIYNLSMSEKPILLSGGDSFKRHLVSPIELKLLNFLLILADFNEQWLLDNTVFNVDKKYIAPAFNFEKHISNNKYTTSTLHFF